MQAEKAPRTRSAYESGWRAFLHWCAAADREALPASPASVRDFVSWCIVRQYRISTIVIRLCAIAHYHQRSGHASPYDEATRRYVANARRELREHRAGKLALSYDMLRRIMPMFPETLTGLRNRAMVLLGFASGWRRSEIVALRYSDVQFVPRGVTLWQRHSKTDQTGQGRLVGIPSGSHELTCPVRALAAWIAVRGDWDGPLFVRLTGRQQITKEALEPRGQMLHLALRHAIRQIGENHNNYGAHSLRSGMVTTSAENGADLPAIMQRTGHRSVQTVLRYVRPAQVFRTDPLAGVL
jgi:integrase